MLLCIGSTLTAKADITYTMINSIGDPWLENITYDRDKREFSFIEKRNDVYDEDYYYRVFVYEHDEDAPLFYKAHDSSTNQNTFGIVKETNWLGKPVPVSEPIDTWDCPASCHQYIDGKHIIKAPVELPMIWAGLSKAYVVILPYSKKNDKCELPTENGSQVKNGVFIHIIPVIIDNFTYDEPDSLPFRKGTVTYQVTVYATNRTTVYFEVFRGNGIKVLEEVTLSAKEAKKGKLLKFTANVGENAPLGFEIYRVEAAMKESFFDDHCQQDWYCFDRIDYSYPIYRITKTNDVWDNKKVDCWVMHDKMTTVQLKGDGCTASYELLSDQPVADTYDRATNQVSFRMPDTDVTLREVIGNKRYKVIFKDNDGTNLNGYSGQLVTCGEDAEAPAAPKHDGLNFIGWSDSYTNIHEDKTIYAQYVSNNIKFEETIVHTRNGQVVNDDLRYGDQIKFKVKVTGQGSIGMRFQHAYHNGTESSAWADAQFFSVAAGGAVNGYETDFITFNIDHTFDYRYLFIARWRLSSGSNTIYTDEHLYTIYYPLDVHNTTSEEIQVIARYPNNNVYTLPTGKKQTVFCAYKHPVAIDADPCCQFSAGHMNTNIIEHAEGSRTFQFDYPGYEDQLTVSMPTYKVYFEVIGSGNSLGYNNVVKIDEVPCGGNAEAPIYLNDPNFPNSTEFDYWMDDYTGDVAVLDDIHEDKWVTAMFRDLPVPPTYTVTFLDWDGTVLSVETVNEGDDAPTPNVNEREGYIFLGWDKSTKDVCEDLTVTAVYSTFLPSTEGLQEIFSSYNVPMQKVIYNGHIYIIRDQRIYDALGRLME